MVINLAEKIFAASDNLMGDRVDWQINLAVLELVARCPISDDAQRAQNT